MKPIYLAVWSGPRNISTAMMRSWENRPDTIVVDEPLYAHYLHQTGLPHPGAEKIIASGETNWRAVVRQLQAPLPAATAVYYQKHMTHHLLQEIDRLWLDDLQNCFLIRNPRDVLLSYRQKREDVTATDLGFPQQLEIYRYLRERAGRKPLVIDSEDFLKAPEPMLRHWCEYLGIEFSPRMLSWPPGPRNSDGVWAGHWYESVEHSTGFMPWRERQGEIPEKFQSVLEQCQACYDVLAVERAQPN